jgi:hypothetical protein
MQSTVEPVNNDHPWDPKIVAVVDRWSLFRGSFINTISTSDLKMVVVNSGLTELYIRNYLDGCTNTKVKMLLSH